MAKQLSIEEIKKRVAKLAEERAVEWTPAEADAESFTIWDEGEEVETTFYPLERNGLDSLRSRIHVSQAIPEKWKPDAKAMAEYLWKYCDRNAFLTVNEIVFVWTGTDDDYDPERTRLATEYNDEYAYFAAEDSGNMFSSTWRDRGIIIVNCGNVYDAAKSIANDDKAAGMATYLKSDYIREVICSTLETLRCLQFMNPIMTAKDYPELAESEEAQQFAANKYANDTYDLSCNATAPIVFGIMNQGGKNMLKKENGIGIRSRSFEVGDRAIRFFMDVPCDATHATAVIEMMSKLDIWYGDTDQYVQEYALEETLWMQMLLRPFKKNGCTEMSVMLNPQNLDISDAEQEDYIVSFITSVAGEEYGTAYKSMRKELHAIMSAWMAAGKPLDFRYVEA